MPERKRSGVIYLFFFKSASLQTYRPVRIRHTGDVDRFFFFFVQMLLSTIQPFTSRWTHIYTIFIHIYVRLPQSCGLRPPRPSPDALLKGLS